MENRKKLIAFLCLFLFGFTLVYGQSTKWKISGKVVDSKNEPLTGAVVIVKGSNIGGTADIDGRFELEVSPGAVLEIKLLGYISKEVTVTSQQALNIVLAEEDRMLTEVTVTALGIKREKKALGYSIGEVGGEELEKAKETNVINSLAGKIPGLIINQTAGGPSGSTRVIIRGSTQLTGNNQPLYVVDGIPLDNTTFGEAGTYGGYDLGDGISAINPDDIENMSVLKGPAASALYGSRASHGVILITTKKAATDKRLGIEFNSTSTLEFQNTNYNNIQTTYGQGSDGLINMTDNRFSSNQNWGPKIDNSMSLLYFDDVWRPYAYVPNNIADFFGTGFTTTNTVVLNSQAEKMSTRLSYTNMYNEDIVPNTGMTRNSLNLRSTATFAKKFDVDVKVNYVNENVKNRPAISDDKANVANNMITLATTFDQKLLKENYRTSTGDYYDWNNGDIYNLNPYWIVYEMQNNSKKNKLMTSGLFKYTLNEKFYAQATVGGELNLFDFTTYTPPTTPNYESGVMNIRNFNNSSYNIEFLANFSDQKGLFNYGLIAGGNIFHVNNSTLTINAKNMILRESISLQSFLEKTPIPDIYEKQISSLFAMANTSYNDFLFLDLTARVDKSSTLPKENNTYLYYSASGSFLFTEILNINKSVLPFGKLRFSYAKVGADTDPYQLSLLYQQTDKTYEGYPTGYIYSGTIPNPELKPTMTNSYEAGLDLNFFRNRIGLNATYYSQLSVNQIMALRISNASGYGMALVNAGAIENKGIEIALNTRPIETKDFSWDVNFNFAKNSNKVLELADGIDQIELQSASWQGVKIAAVKNENFGSILGKDYKRNANGDIIINPASGLPELTEDLQVLGNASWDWTGGITTSLNYKNWTLTGIIDVKVGADLYSMTAVKLARSGKLKTTLEGRDAWYQSEEKRLQAGVLEGNWTPTGGYIAQGVVETTDAGGNTIYEENTKKIDPQDYWVYITDNVAAPFVYDNSYVKLREITLTYRLPNNLISKFAESCSVSFVARNPFIIYKSIDNIDPESNYNNSFGMGLEYGSLPSRRSYGLNLSIKF